VLAKYSYDSTVTTRALTRDLTGLCLRLWRWSQTESSKFLQVVAGAPIAYGIEQVWQAP